MEDRLSELSESEKKRSNDKIIIELGYRKLVSPN